MFLFVICREQRITESRIGYDMLSAYAAEESVQSLHDVGGMDGQGELRVVEKKSA